MRTRKVVINGTTYIAMQAKFSSRCSACNHPFPIKKNDPMTLVITADGKKSAIHVNCTPPDVNSAFAQV